MARISSIELLPDHQRAQLEAEAARMNYCQIDRLADWAKQQGIKVSGSSLARYFKKNRAVIERVMQAYPQSRNLPRSPEVVAALAELGVMELRRAELLAFLAQAVTSYSE
ncbi:phage protein Gp27 family protein [Plasticicumulans acidivorans]|uniref:Uncharacterized protein DUF3486 n=1 Tax=Plasticicumulans acidivorans TaxID=886464 RepID=A0A317MZ12_9GAMM|nr:phage protein Gp27 family protein [Plasticicumulans acidivorans]PWV64910.1 uncharacterized protein DUF3486 [Plasticicumulans acidivorans]